MRAGCANGFLPKSGHQAWSLNPRGVGQAASNGPHAYAFSYNREFYNTGVSGDPKTL